MTTDLSLVLKHPGFFRVERSTLPPEGARWGQPIPDGAYRDHWQVGVSLTEGRVDWWEGATAAEALSLAAAAILARVHGVP